LDSAVADAEAHTTTSANRASRRLTRSAAVASGNHAGTRGARIASSRSWLNSTTEMPRAAAWKWVEKARGEPGAGRHVEAGQPLGRRVGVGADQAAHLLDQIEEEVLALLPAKGLAEQRAEPP